MSPEGNIEITVEQKQNFKKVPLYRLPIEVDFYVSGKVERTKIIVTEAKQTFTVKVSAVPELVNFDAEKQLLCDLDYAKTQEEYIFQYKNAPLFMDRYEALTKLESKITEPNVYSVFKWAAENDKYFILRNFAIIFT